MATLSDPKGYLSVSGAFQQGEKTLSGAFNGAVNLESLDFNAHASNSLYNASTVTVPSLKTLHLIKI